MKTTTLAFSAATLLITTCLPAGAQQTTGVPGSPSGTTTIDGKQLPPPDPKFGGVIKDDALQSKPWWAPRVVPPESAPNVLLIITDDAGFGVPSTFGGVIPTPTMDRIANEGLRYNRIFSTALCSPTRAALITGRNHHSVGFGVISEQSTGFPGYNSIIGKDKATIGRILLDNGYSTAWFGKDHNTPAFAASQAGPFDQWPTGMGFEYFYGFVGGDANQWQPNLFRNTTQIYPFLGKPPGTWNLITAMADDAIDYMTRMHQTDPSKPIFIKYAPGATHAPHHPTQEWVDKIHAMHLFDGGYNKLRERIFENQKRLGVIAKDSISNTPLHWVLDSRPRRDTLAFQVDLFSAMGELPHDLTEAEGREKDIRFSSRTRAAIDQYKYAQKLRIALASLLKALPNELKTRPEAKLLAAEADDKVCDIVELIYKCENYEGIVKDYEFSRRTMEEHWEKGYDETIRTLSHPEALKRPDKLEGVRTFDVSKFVSV